MDRHERVRDRVAQLPDAVWDCEACGGTDTMKVRRGSLRENPCAEDTTLKCMSCFRIRTHGIPIERAVYKADLDDRPGRTLDFVNDGPNDGVAENLSALGYVDY